MSSIATGAARVGKVLTALSKQGYRCARLSHSGQRRGKRKDEAMVAGDAMAWPPNDSMLPYWLIEVGGSGKRLAVAFAELEHGGLPPGWRPLVVRFVDRKQRWYTSPDDCFENFERILWDLVEVHELRR